LGRSRAAAASACSNPSAGAATPKRRLVLCEGYRDQAAVDEHGKNPRVASVRDGYAPPIRGSAPHPFRHVIPPAAPSRSDIGIAAFRLEVELLSFAIS
jgi:hypothetical protein